MLKKRALSATLWSGADIATRQVVRFGITVVLARLLDPAAFGTIALLALFIGVANALVDGGFAAALLQRQDATWADESTVFWFNASAGLGVASLLCVAADPISRFYHSPVLRLLTIVMALNIFIGALGSIHVTRLTKQLRFSTLLVINMLATAVGGVVAIGMALEGYGVWALAAQVLLASTISTAALWIVDRWRPLLAFRLDAAKELLAFGGYNLAANLLDVVYSRIYTLLIGRLYDTRSLGFYANAEATSHLPGNLIGAVMARVAFPMFAAEAANKASLRRGVQLSIRGMMLISAPIILGLAATAEPFVLAVFGEQWLPTVPLLRILCIASLLIPLHMINLQVLMATGYAKEMFGVEVSKKLMGLILLCTGAYYDGVRGIAWSQAVLSVVGLAFNTHYANRLIDYGAIAQLRDFAPPVLVSATMALCVFFIGELWSAEPLLKLLELFLLGLCIFVVLTAGLRLKAWADMIELFRLARGNSPVAKGSA